MEFIAINYHDQVKSRLRVYPSSGATTTMIIFPAMGTKARYYDSFAEALAQTGYHVIIADWRGHGESSVRASRTCNFGYKELIEDIGEVVNKANSLFKDTKIVFLGHSLGGQLGSIYASRYPEKVRAIILIASCLVYYKGWEGWKGIRVLIGVTVMHWIAALFGYLPGKQIGFAGREARQVMWDWSLNGRTGNYKVRHDTFAYDEALSRLDKNVLAMSIDPDELAPKKAVENLLHKFGKQSAIQHLHIGGQKAGVKGLNHFNWAKHPDYFVQVIADWEKTLD